MLQRVQTLFLAGVPLILLVLLFVPIYQITGKVPGGEQNLTLLSGILPLILNILPAALAVFTIFRFTNRLQQIKLCTVGMLLSALVLVLMFLLTEQLFPVTRAEVIVSFGWGIYLLPANVLLFFLASRFIRRDENLVRSADRLR